MASNQYNNQDRSGIEPVHSLQARLEFESDAWTANLLGSECIGWNPVFDPTKDLAAYHRLAISPFRLEDLLSIWRMGAKGSRSLNVILDCEVKDAIVDNALEVLRTLHKRTVDLVGTDTAEGLLILDDNALELYAKSFAIEELALVRIDGPIDRGDILAMLTSASQARSPLDAELRAVAAAEFVRGGPTILESREIDVVAAALGMDLARYVESVLRVPSGEIPRPPDSEVMRLLAKSGSILIRPQDTELLGHNVDVGICTSRSTRRRQIDTSLVFCRPDGTWHAREAA